MNTKYIEKFRETLLIFEKEIFIQNSASCCNGVSLAQCHTLLEIEKNSQISISELADNLSLDKSTVSRTVDGLVNISLIDRVIPKENRRKALLNLTKNGSDMCCTINDTNNSYLQNALKDFTSQEQEEFLRLFNKLTNSMNELRQTDCNC